MKIRKKIKMIAGALIFCCVLAMVATTISFKVSNGLCNMFFPIFLLAFYALIKYFAMIIFFNIVKGDYSGASESTIIVWPLFVGACTIPFLPISENNILFLILPYILIGVSISLLIHRMFKNRIF